MRDGALAAAAAELESGRFQALLAHLVAQRTDSVAGDPAVLDHYLDGIIAPLLAGLGFETAARGAAAGNRFLVSRRIEDPALPTVLLYGHGDVVPGMEGQWAEGLDPWVLTPRGDRLYGRGAADNKGQHAINITAIGAALKARGGRLGCNLVWLMEMGEERGSPGLRDFCRAHREALRADLLIASDGPRVASTRPTIFLGARGGLQIRLTADLRPGAYHSGNWGGLLPNPGTILANAIASLVDGQGRILLPILKPGAIPADVRAALADITPEPGPDDPAIDPAWGEPGLTPVERVYGFNTLEVLAFGTGNIARPIGAIPGRAEAMLQLRYVVGTDTAAIPAALRAHLDARGFAAVALECEGSMGATRMPLDNPWVRFAAASLTRTLGRAPALLPNFGGSLPNDVFVEELGLVTLWVPHAHPACGQHAPDEHLLRPVAGEALRMMAGLVWDMGEARKEVLF
ncbi:M20 family metallopeptidase [Roseomonas sp. GC11]|uniref:M20 family metallopeptidase n=1 Tax=Roseomonas sp. GC11 TaxID=2950546 RepID=UPI00210A5BE7|nr:M20 family metallopeptidase [Roseomonas sp. GC11]MCQ4162045.1 M20 family metallopeptidase [Roseomonas sp. GC11]